MNWLNKLFGKRDATSVPRADAETNTPPSNPGNRTPLNDPDNTMRLYEACAEGDPAKVRAALAQQPDVNSTDWPSGFTPLHVCVSGSDKVERQEIVRLLHAAGAVLEAKDLQKGLTPLHYAALRDKPLCVAALLECGADIHATEANGATALHGAAYHGHIEVAEVLLQHGADPAMKDFRGNTPNALAASRGQETLVSLFRKTAGPIENQIHNSGQNVDRAISPGGFNPDLKHNGELPLIKAAELGQSDIVQALLNKGADINVKASDGVTPIVVASLHNRKEIVDLLIAAGADVNICASSGGTALIAAAQDGNVEIIDTLLKAGANALSRKADGANALIMAAQEGHGAAVRALIPYSQLNARMTVGATALMLAADGGHYSVVQDLLRAGARPSVRGPGGATALDIALSAGHRDIAELLYRAGG